MSLAMRDNKYRKNIVMIIFVTYRNKLDYFLDLKRIQDLVLCLQKAMFSIIA